MLPDEPPPSGRALARVDGEFAYLEYRLDDIIYNAADLDDLATEQHS